MTTANITITDVTIANTPLTNETITVINTSVTIGVFITGQGTWLSNNAFVINLLGINIVAYFTENPNVVALFTLDTLPSSEQEILDFISTTETTIDTFVWTGNLPSDPVSLPPTNNIPTGNICFVKGTPVLTDLGEIDIDKLNPDIHTIADKPIICITKTISSDEYLVCFEKDAICYNVPSRRTIISQEHKLMYKGKMVEAKEFIFKPTHMKKVDFIAGFNKIYKIKYTGDILYNVVMTNHDKMMVNNLICETLHPKNAIAVSYKRLQRKKQQNLLISSKLQK